MSDIKLINDFLIYLRDSRKTSANTLAAYERDLLNFNDFLATKKLSLENACSDDIGEFKSVLTASGRSVATVSRCMSSLRGFYKFLVGSNVLTLNPAVDVKNDKTEKKFFEILTEDEIDRLLSIPDVKDFKGKRDKAMLEVLYATGMKVTELMNLDISDVNLKMNYVRCRNGSGVKNSRVVLLYPKAVKALEDYITKARNYFLVSDSESALFVNVNGERMTRQGFWKLLKSYASLANINKSITPHTLRHSFATHLLENGADINDIKNILGHADISSTLVYSNYIKSKLDNSYLKFNHRSR